MRGLILSLALLPIVLLFTGCTSLKGKAKHFLEVGAYEQALDYYQRAVDKDPADAEARSGLNLARTKYIDKKLIETRMARLGGNSQNAMDLLLDVVQKEKTWQFAPVGQVSGTQEEETAEGLRFLEAKSQQAISSDRPLVGLYFYKHYQPVFESSIPGAYSQSLKKVQAKGKTQCQKLSKLREKGRPYFSQFVARICGVWGQEQKDLAAISTEIAKTLFNSVSAKYTIEHLEPSLRSELDALVQEAFRQTPWHNANSLKKLMLGVNGTFNRQHSEQVETLIHNYSVMEPYTAYEEVKKTRTVPYSDFQMQCYYDSKNQSQCSQNPVTKYRQEEYSETEARTRYREVPRTFPYSATRLRQIVELSLDGKLDFPAEPQNIGLQEKYEKAGYRHEHNRPDIGLKPSDPGLADPNVWFRDQARAFSGKVRSQSEQYWSALFCRAEAGSALLATTGEQVQKCLANSQAGSPSFADLWYQAHFGLTLAQARELSI